MWTDILGGSGSTDPCDLRTARWITAVPISGDDELSAETQFLCRTQLQLPPYLHHSLESASLAHSILIHT